MKPVRQLFILVVLFFFTWSIASAQSSDADVANKCIACHQENTPGLVQQWKHSKHAENEVGCLDCHSAEKSEPDAFLHEGAYIATLVTPKDCGQCHEKEATEEENSYHATAGLILESKDAFLGYVGGGTPAVNVGCESCHGTKVIIDPNSPNKLSPKSLTNSGIGRINPDGSKGSCTACHTRHSFSVAQARQPEACGKCHLGPDHPQEEIYKESKHGNVYYTNKDKMNLNSGEWVVGKDYYEAPTCATCHISATRTQGVTHDVGTRLKWTLRPPISKTKPNWKQKRNNMIDVCSACHTEKFIDSHFYQADALVRLYDTKFAIPAGKIMKMIKKKGLEKSKASFGNEIDWIYFELWHHEGRRARMGAEMMGPDYAWWHGIYDVIHNFYFKFIPAARAYNDKEVNDYINNLLTTDPMHNWLYKSTKDLKGEIRSGQLQKIYEKLFTTKEK